MGNAVYANTSHLSVHSLYLPPSLKMAKPTHCESAKSMAAPMAVSTSRIQKRRSYFTLSLQSISVKKEWSLLALFGHQTVAHKYLSMLHGDVPVRSALFCNA